MRRRRLSTARKLDNWRPSNTPIGEALRNLSASAAIADLFVAGSAVRVPLRRNPLLTTRTRHSSSSTHRCRGDRAYPLTFQRPITSSLLAL